jgi:hypothetical protein
MSADGEMVDFGRRDGPLGMVVDVDLDRLVDQVFVAPSCSARFPELVNHIPQSTAVSA